MYCEPGNVLSMLNVIKKCEVFIKKCHHILDMLPYFVVLAKELICVIKFLLSSYPLQGQIQLKT